MTEEIIIDGVDVAGCRHCMYKGFKAFPQCRLELDSFATACTQHKECEYKQLKRLEQENKELKIYIESNKQQVEEAEMLVMDNDRLQQEVENLKDIIYYDVEKYRSALEEIRENLVKLKTNDEDDFTYEYSKIEDKINEVL